MQDKLRREQECILDFVYITLHLNAVQWVCRMGANYDLGDINIIFVIITSLQRPPPPEALIGAPDPKPFSYVLRLYRACVLSLHYVESTILVEDK